MTYKSVTLLFTLPIIASCTLFGTSSPTDFAGMYKAHVTSQVASLNTLAKDFGYMDSYALDGSIHLAASMPSFFSGVLSTDYTTQVNDKRDTKTVFKNLLAQYDILGGSGKLKVDEASMITKAGDMFFRFSNLESQDMIDSDMAKVLAKYNNAWLAMTRSDMFASLSGSSEDEKLSYKISQAFSEITLKDIEKYLTTYPLWKETKDLGMSGTLHQYEVELAKENIIAMAQDFSQKATEKAMTPEALKNLTENLNTLNIKGVLAFNKDDAREAHFNGTLTDTTGSGTIVNLGISETKDGLSLTSGNANDNLTVKIEKDANNTTNGLVIATKNGKELTRIESALKRKGDHVQSLDIKLVTSELTITLNHTNNTDGTFEGKLNGGIGNITWKGKIETNGLSDFHVTGAAMGTSLSLDLTPSADGILKGPVSLKSGDTEVFHANTALALSKERLFLSLDIANPEEPTYKTHGEIDVKVKHSPWNGAIETPKDTRSFKSLTDELSAISPKEIPEDNSGNIQ